jgi:hypothetical protein
MLSMPEPKPKAAKKMWLLAASIFVVVICGFLLVFGASRNDNSPSVPVKTYTEIKATDLYNAYNNNSVRADQLYKGQYLKVSGYVGSIGTDILGSPYIVVTGGGEYDSWGVQCVFPSINDVKSKIASYNKGDSIWVKGKCTGYLINVLLEVD